jgi:hypothetical protein
LIDYVYDWNSNAAPNVIREFRTTLRGTGKITRAITKDAGGNQISQACLDAYISSDTRATVDFTGIYHLGGSIIGWTDFSGHMKVTFPTRPETGLPLFLQTPHVVVTAENLSGYAAPVMIIVARNRSHFTIKFIALSRRRPVSINYIAYGQ